MIRALRPFVQWWMLFRYMKGGRRERGKEGSGGADID